MADYKQHLPMNCGGTAAVFAVYGEREKVPDSALPTLQSEGLAAVSISDFINSSPAHMTAKSVFYGQKVKVSGGSELKIEFLESLSNLANVLEGIGDIIVTNKLRCLILTCRTPQGPHWQTFFLRSQLGKVQIHNERSKWWPMLFPVASTPTGAVLVTGMPIPRQS